MVAYYSFYLWIILYISFKLKALNQLRHILYALQLILSALAIIAFALLYTKIKYYCSYKYKSIMIFSMILTGLLSLFSIEHFIIRKEFIFL